MPTALNVFRGSSNTSDLVIQPIIDENARNIFYQISSSSTFTAWTSPITLTAPNNIVFIQCQYNSTFNLGKSEMIFFILQTSFIHFSMTFT